jgi:transcriptional regulator with XRE-family HTH domain
MVMPRSGDAITREASTKGGDDSELMLRLARAIRAVRVSRGLTQRDLGARVGKSQNYIWLLESGKKDPGVLFLRSLARALNMPLDFFFVCIAEPRSESAPERQVAFREGRDLMLSLLDGLAGSVDEDRERKRSGQAENP